MKNVTAMPLQRQWRASLLLLLTVVGQVAGACPKDTCETASPFQGSLGPQLSAVPCMHSLVGAADPATEQMPQGFTLAPFNRVTGTTDTIPPIPAPGGRSEAIPAAAVLRLSKPGAAAAYQTRLLSLRAEKLSFSWYLCSHGTYTAQTNITALSDAQAIKQAAADKCHSACSPWCNRDSCISKCCPDAIPECASCPGACDALCAGCRDDCAGAGTAVQTARVDLWVADAGASEAQFVDVLSQRLLAPSVTPCDSTLGCDRTLLSPEALGAQETQCGWQSHTMTLEEYAGRRIALVFRAIDTTESSTARLAFAFSDIHVTCYDSGIPTAALGTPPHAAMPPPTPPPPQDPPPSPPTPPMGCHKGPCDNVLGPNVNITTGSLGPCVATAVDCTGCSGFVPYVPAGDGTALAVPRPPPPPAQGSQGAAVAALQLERPGAAVLMYSRFVASAQEVLSVRWYMCASAYSDADIFSLSSLIQATANASAACNTACDAACMACAARCCSAAGCDAACMGTCCFSCRAHCNSLGLTVQTARIDVYRGRPEQVSTGLFAGNEPCSEAAGCVALGNASAILRAAASECAWRTDKWSLAAYVGQYITVVFRALDSRSPTTLPLSFAIDSVNTSCDPTVQTALTQSQRTRRLLGRQGGLSSLMSLGWSRVVPGVTAGSDNSFKAVQEGSGQHSEVVGRGSESQTCVDTGRQSGQEPRGQDHDRQGCE